MIKCLLPSIFSSFSPPVGLRIHVNHNDDTSVSFRIAWPLFFKHDHRDKRTGSVKCELEMREADALIRRRVKSH